MSRSPWDRARPSDMFDWEDEKLEDRCLDLEGKNIGANDIGIFLQSIKEELDAVSRLKVVNLSDNRVGLGGESLESVDTLLTASSGSLTALNLHGNPLGVGQRHAGPVAALSDTLTKLPRLKVLDISRCTLLGRTGHRYRELITLGRALAYKRITRLRISDNSLHSEAAMIVGGWFRGIPKLRYLDISENPLNFDPLGSPSRAGFAALCRSLVDLYYLRTLLMRDVGIDDVGAEELAAYVSSSVCIQSLDLSFNQINVGGARYLATAMRSNGTLRSLILERNRIGDRGGQLLATSIPHAASLTELELSSNGLTVGVKASLVSAALASSTIEIYGLAGNDIPPVDVEEIQEHASANVELRAVAQDPESYDLGKVSSIVRETLVTKFGLLPEGVAQVLKGNRSFVDEDGPIRDAVFSAAPPTKAELMRNSAGKQQVVEEELTRALNSFSASSVGRSLTLFIIHKSASAS